MIIKANSTPHFNLTLTIDVNLKLEYINILVSLHNKNKNTMQTKQFFSDLKAALQHYKNLENMFI